jgi:hypothetical protein
MAPIFTNKYTMMAVIGIKHMLAREARNTFIQLIEDSPSERSPCECSEDM